jgi:hypothetical protein
MEMKMAYWTLGAILILVGIVWFVSQSGPNLAAEYRRQRDAEPLPLPSQPVLTEADIAELPAPVQRYIRVTGFLGRPQVSNVAVYFDTEMFSAPGSSGMRGPSIQYDRQDGPKRLFFMKTKMYGLPVTVLHNFEGLEASMRVRVASLFTVADVKSQELARAESVTILNDWCLYAPSWLIDKRLSWTAVNDNSASVAFQNGPHKVSATVYFNDAGELVNFVSEDRSALQNDGSLRRARWSTPMSDYQSFEGRRLATKGEAIWNYPEGDFTYGKFLVRNIRFDVTKDD